MPPDLVEAYWKLRRLAPRALRIIERRKAVSPAVAAYATTLVPKATTFTAT